MNIGSCYKNPYYQAPFRESWKKMTLVADVFFQSSEYSTEFSRRCNAEICIKLGKEFFAITDSCAVKKYHYKHAHFSEC